MDRALVGPKPTPPVIEPNEALIELGGRFAVSASNEVQEALRRVTDSASEFEIAVYAYRASRDSDSRPEGERPWAIMQAARQQVVQEIESAQRLMRDELDQL